LRSCGIVAGIAASIGLAACGGGSRQDAQEPNETFPVQIAAATFPSAQRLAEHTHLVILVRNTGRHTIPDVAVTITDPHYGTSVQAFGQYMNMPGLANHSRPVWIVDRAPEPGGTCAYSCEQGGPGGAVTAYSNTWALGALRPGAMAKFDWALTAVAPGKHTIQYEIAAGLNGKAKARVRGGGIPKGVFTVDISNRPQQSYVSGSGQIVKTQ
jgi:hypothetical protein